MLVLALVSDHQLKEALLTCFRFENIPITIVKTITDYKKLLKSNNHIACLLIESDLNNYKDNTIINTIRDETCTLPIIAMSTNDSIRNKVAALDSGADHFLAVPFMPAELFSRIRATVRRYKLKETSTIRLGKLEYDQKSLTTWLNGAVLNITSRETLLLSLFMQSNERVVTRERMKDYVSQFGITISNPAIEVYVHRLRQRIIGSEVIIETVKGQGYKLTKV